MKITIGMHKRRELQDEKGISFFLRSFFPHQSRACEVHLQRSRRKCGSGMRQREERQSKGCAHVSIDRGRGQQKRSSILADTYIQNMLVGGEEIWDWPWRGSSLQRCTRECSQIRGKQTASRSTFFSNTALFFAREATSS